MRIYDYLETLPVDFSCKKNLLNYMLGAEGTNRTFCGYMHLSKKNDVPPSFKINENVLELMSVVNRMVKDKNCPHNLRNRFYNYKTSIMRNLSRMERVSDVYDEGNYLSMTVDSKYVFHQLKTCCVNLPLEIVGEREYENTQTPLPFDEKVYREFQISAIYFLGKCRFDKMKYNADPKHFQKKWKES